MDCQLGEKENSRIENEPLKLEDEIPYVNKSRRTTLNKDEIPVMYIDPSPQQMKPKSIKRTPTKRLIRKSKGSIFSAPPKKLGLQQTPTFPDPKDQVQTPAPHSAQACLRNVTKKRLFTQSENSKNSKSKRVKTQKHHSKVSQFLTIPEVVPVKTIPQNSIKKNPVRKVQMRKSISLPKLRELNSEQLTSSFVAKKLNPQILNNPWVPEKEEKKFTQTFAFSFETEKRVCERIRNPLKLSDLKEERENRFKAKPVPNNQPFQIKKRDKSEIEVKEFNLRAEKRVLEKRQVSKKEEAKIIKFAARPAPRSTSVPIKPHGIPNKGKNKTIPEEFKLTTQARGKKAKEEWEKKTQQELNEIKEQMLFKSGAMPKYPSFKPLTKDAPPPTQTIAFQFNLEKRCEERNKFFHEQESKRKQEELKRQEEEEQRKQEELEEVKELRKQMVFKHRSITKGKPLVIQKSCTVLTRPKSPYLCTSQRVEKDYEQRRHQTYECNTDLSSFKDSDFHHSPSSDHDYIRIPQRTQQDVFQQFDQIIPDNEQITQDKNQI